jgi:hypothetical protein
MVMRMCSEGPDKRAGELCKEVEKLVDSWWREFPRIKDEIPTLKMAREELLSMQKLEGSGELAFKRRLKIVEMLKGNPDAKTVKDCEYGLIRIIHTQQDHPDASKADAEINAHNAAALAILDEVVLKLQEEQEEPAELPAELMTDLANVEDLFAASDYSSGVDKPFVPMEEGGSMDFMAGEFDMEFPQ